MMCDRCAVACDVGDTPPKCAVLTLGRMRSAAINEAERIEASAACAVKNGFRKHRDQPALKSALELRKCGELIDRCLCSPEILSRLARSASKPNEKNNTAETQG